MRKTRKRGNLSVKDVVATSITLQPSAHTSRYPSEDEEHIDPAFKAFNFLGLPSELRNKIYELHFNRTPSTIDLDPDNFKKIHQRFNLFLVSRQIHDEASHHFYSTHKIRLFPTHPGRFFKTKKPLLSRLPPHYRASITSFQLRLGPGFTNPPRGWIVNDALGLKDATSVRILEVFVEVDTSDPFFKGFRRDEDGFYEKFSSNLMNEILEHVPSIVEIQFDAYPSVRMDGDMMRGLIGVANKHNKVISWGPERGWKEDIMNDCFNQTFANALTIMAA